MGFNQGLSLACVVLSSSLVSITQVQAQPPTGAPPVPNRQAPPQFSLPPLPFPIPGLPFVVGTPPPTASPGPASDGVPDGAARIGSPLSPAGAGELTDPLPPSPMDSFPTESPLSQPVVGTAPVAPVAPGPGLALDALAPAPGPSPVQVASTQKSGAVSKISGAFGMMSAAIFLVGSIFFI